MTITTEFLLRSPSLPLVSLPEMLRTDRVECIHGLCFGQDARMFVVKIDADEDVSETELTGLDEVSNATTIGRAGEQTVHKLTVELDDEISETFNESDSGGAKLEPTVVTPEGWYEKKVYSDREALARSRDNCQRHGISLDLISLSPAPDTSDDSPPFGLTDRQYEALSLALSRGYYESPRQTTTKELADELGISQASMSNLLRRGERQLLSSALQTEGYLNALSS
jgi:predicted DNA binding protein